MNAPPTPTLSRVAMFLASFGGTGFLPVAPGTWGSLAALPFAWLLLVYGGWLGLLLATVIVTPLGIWASGRVAREKNMPDPGLIVIDEVAGQWLTLLPVGFMMAAPGPVAILIGFLLFRLFDILKPWPASWADRRIKGGFGVMLDDLLAGLYAAALLAAAIHFGVANGLEGLLP